MKLVIFAGGVGSRLWPLSRKDSPKQFEKIIGDDSTLQLTIKRLLPDFAAKDIFIATGKHYEDATREQLDIIPKDNFIFEPTMRDVGPAIGLASFILAKLFPDEAIAILWSDHLVKNEELFIKSLRLAEKKVLQNEADFVFIAQKPRFANQNIGWIETGEQLEENDGITSFRFKKLVYKPETAEAGAYFKNDRFVWNLGYFVTRPTTLQRLYEKHEPKMAKKLQELADGWGTDAYERKLLTIYPTLEKISFDDAVLTKLDPGNQLVVSAELGWSDVGAWDALKEALSDTREQNRSESLNLLKDSEDSLLFNYSDQLCIGVELKEMIVINTADVLLICPKSFAPKIKQLVEELVGTEHEHLV